MDDNECLSVPEIQEYITENLLRKRKDLAELEILELCEKNQIKGAKRKIINDFYRAEKQEYEEKRAVENDPMGGVRELYSSFIHHDDPAGIVKDIKMHLSDSWLESSYSDTSDFVKGICEVYNLDSVHRESILEFFKKEKADETGEITEITEEQEKTGYCEEYINDTVREWSQYQLPVAKKGEYSVNSSGVYRIVETFDDRSQDYVTKTYDVCRTPFVVCGISVPIKDSDIFYKIRYLDYNQEIQEFWSKQTILMSKKELKDEFLRKGINCPENEVLKETIEYISLSVNEFGHRFKREFSSSQCGWTDDQDIFVLGDRAISEDGITPILSVGGTEGIRDLGKAGTLEGWMDGTREIFEYDLIRFKAYDAMSAPLKAILGVESHVSDHFGNSSSGKTFSGKVALSMVGDPKTLINGAKGTMKGLLVWIRDFSDLPLLIDETSDAGEHIKDLIYPLTSDKGRVKSTQDGKRDGEEEYHTTVMLTGEKPVRDHLTNAGQMYRVNQLDETLPVLDQALITDVQEAVRKNHGHIIENFLEIVFRMKKTGHLDMVYRSCIEKLPETHSNIEGRSRNIFGCIMTAGWILEQVFKQIGFPRRDPFEIVQNYFIRCIQDKPVELEYIRALRAVLDWTVSDRSKFIICKTGYDDDITILDKSKTYGFLDETYIDIIGSEFTKKMKAEGFSPTKVKEDWNELGLTISNDKQRKGLYRGEKKGFGKYNCVRLNREIVENFLGLNDETDIQVLNRFGENIAQTDKVRNIMEIVRSLSVVKGQADISLLRAILEYPDLDDYLAVLSQRGSILRLTMTSYRSVFD